MKWLAHRNRQIPQGPVDTRFVAQEPPRRPDTAAGQAATRAAVPGMSMAAIEQEQLSCTLVTEDRDLIDLVAGIALGAAVRINHCASPERFEERLPEGPVLWGADALCHLNGARRWRCDVLLGTETDSEQLWLTASTRPQARVAVLPLAAGWLGEYLGQWALHSGHGHTIVFSGLAGGIGTSALSALLAHAGTLSGLRSVVVDLDPYSGSLWPMLNWQPANGIGWEHLRGSGGTLAAHQFREVLARVQDTAVLTWQQEPSSYDIDESLAVRVLAAARQAFDLVVIDTGRYLHPLSGVIAQFANQQVLTCQPEQGARLAELGHPFIACTTSQKVEVPGELRQQLLGCFPPTSRIARSIERAELFDSLRSGRLRQRIADYDLLPTTGTGHP